MILVAYASKHGATEGIAQFIAQRFNELGRQAEAEAVRARSCPMPRPSSWGARSTRDRG